MSSTRAELQLREKGIIVRGEFAQPAALQGIHFGQRAVVRLEQRRMARRR